MKRYDISNQKFGKLIALKFDKIDRKRTYWLCECDCGFKKSIQLQNLLTGHTTSCGCKLKPRQKNCNWKGNGQVSSLFYASLRRQAIKRKKEFKISLSYVADLFEKQKGKCGLSDISICFSSTSRTFDGNASLDRIDSSKGYVEGNVQWVHKDINLMKSSLSEEKFFNYCQKIILHKRLKF